MKTARVAATIAFILVPGGAVDFAQQPATASISGVVVRADTGEPIAGARVIVSVNGQDGGSLLAAEPDSEPLGFLPQVTADAHGRFLFTDLRTGSYIVAAQSSGFAPQQYGARKPRRRGTRLTIFPGQPASAIVIPLVATGAISGRVTDDTGRPLARMPVVVERVAYGADGKRTRKAVNTSHTDERGEYRAYWITPGRYYVLTAPLRSGVRAIAEAGYPATYYPGIVEQSGATAIDVEPGAEVNAIDVTLSRQPVFRVRGRFPDGFRPDLVWLCSNAFADGSDREGTVSSDGSFEIRNVAPGSYSIHASSGELPLLRGTIDVSVADVDNVMLTSDQGTSIAVRWRWEGAAPLQPGEDWRLQLDPVTTCAGDERTLLEAPDGSRQFKHVVAGDYRLRTILPAGTYVKSIRLNGIDAMNGFSVPTATAASLDIVFSNKASRIEGTVLDRTGRSMPGVEVVLLPIREADRTPERVVAVVTDQYGRFDLQSIAPGDYRLFAWEDVEPYAYYDADFVRPYTTAGTLIRVSESSRQSVQIVSIPPR